jgi:hypothetical protein
MESSTSLCLIVPRVDSSLPLQQNNFRASHTLVVSLLLCSMLMLLEKPGRSISKQCRAFTRLRIESSPLAGKAGSVFLNYICVTSLLSSTTWFLNPICFSGLPGKPVPHSRYATRPGVRFGEAGSPGNRRGEERDQGAGGAVVEGLQRGLPQSPRW